MTTSDAAPRPGEGGGAEPKSTTNCTRALALAALGWPVFPCHTPLFGAPGTAPKCSCGKPDCKHIGKHPRTPHGLLDASIDPAVIAAWWGEWPTANVAVRTGPDSAVALDIDPRNGGDATLGALEAKHGALPTTVSAMTGGGGRHILFSHPGMRIKSRTLAPGIDIKADGGYIVVDPSVHVSSGRYAWSISPGEVPLAPMPAWLLHLAMEQTTGAQGVAAADGMVIPEGQRNHALTAMAGAMRRRSMGYEAILAALQAENTQRCQPPLCETEVERIARSVANYPPGGSGGSGSPPTGGAPDSWPEPRHLPGGLPPVMAFDPDLLPEAIRGWIVDIAERVQCPIDFPAVSAIVAISALVGRKVGIRPKRQDDWLVVPNLWGAAIGRPGVMKTPAILEPLRPLKRLEMLAKEAFEAKAAEFEAAKIVNKVKGKAAESDIKKALSKEGQGAAMRIAMESLPGDEGEPVRKRYIINDSTVEKLGVILNQNPFGVLVYRDELIGLLKGLDKEGQDSARSFYLEAWNGTGRFTYDRIERGTIDIEAAIVSIMGGIQPGPLGQYFAAAAEQGLGDDGLVQRFQLIVWPDISREWVNVDRWPDSEARKRAYAVFDGLDHLEAGLLGADHDPADPDGIPFLRFAEEAQVLFDAWRAGLEKQVRDGDLHPALESHFAKYRSLIPSLALLLHLADGASGPVGVIPLQRALRWAEYLASHARRIYAQAIHPHVAAAFLLAKKIVAGELKDGFAARDVYRHGWTGLVNSSVVHAAADLLVDHDWLRQASVLTDGRTATVYLINPRLRGSEAARNLRTPPKGTDEGDRRGSEGASGGSVSPDPAPPQKSEPQGGWEEA